VPAFESATEIGRALRAGRTTSRDVAQAALEAIEALEPRLNAYRVVLRDRALADADEAQRRLERGDESPLLGVPIALKDNVDLAGEATTHGTGAFGGPAAQDAELVRRLRAAGALIVGKTTMPELAAHPFTESITWGATRNPWDPGRTTGGSSGGSGATVASGAVPLAHATDGGGSIRLPAAWCGLFGLKPTRGRVSLAPDDEHWHGLSVANCVARTVLDSAIFLDAVADEPHESFADATASEPGRLRIAWTVRPPQPGRVNPAIRAAVRETAALLERLGHQVREVAPRWPLPQPGFVPRYLSGVAGDAGRLPHPELLEARSRHIAAMGRALPDGAVARSRQAGERYTQRLAELFGDADVVLCPVVPHPPRRVGAATGHGALRTMSSSTWTVAFTAPWNISGRPAASVPAGLGPDGLPVAVQLAGAPGAEATLLSLAAQLERERPWAHLRPRIADPAGRSGA